MTDLQRLTNQILKFRDARDWKQFHTPKDVILSLMLEVSELAEHVQWKSAGEIQSHLESHKTEVGDELADILYWVLLISADFDIDLGAAFAKKMEKNEQKYPIEKSKGRHKKYDEI